MSDNLKESQAEFDEVWLNFSYVDMRQCAEFFWKAGIASQQAAHDAEIARLKENFDGLKNVLHDTQKELSAANAACAMKDAALKEIAARNRVDITKTEPYASALSASPQQVSEWEAKKLEPLRERIAILEAHCTWLFGMVENVTDEEFARHEAAMTDNQATAEQFVLDIEKSLLCDLSAMATGAGNLVLAQQLKDMEKLRATSKKAG